MNKAARFLFLAILLLILAFLAVIYLFPHPRQKVTLYFFKDGELAPVKRMVSTGAPDPRQVIEELLKGPARSETGYFSQIPAGTRLRALTVAEEVAYPDFSRELRGYGGGAAKVRGMVAQIVYTLTEIPGIRKVHLLVAGDRSVILGGEGFVLDHPLSRADLGY